MDALHTILNKRDTRRFLDRAVDEEDLHKVLQAGRMAGSAKNSQLNRIVVVTDQETRERLSKCGDFAEWVPGAPVILVLVAPHATNRPFDLGRMAQNMMVAAQSLGLASCPVTFHHQDCVREVLDLPDDYDAPMGVGVGCPGPPDPGRKSSPRIPLDELVKWGSWSG